MIETNTNQNQDNENKINDIFSDLIKVVKIINS